MKVFILLKKIRNYLIYFIKGGVKYSEATGVKVGDNCRIYTRNFGSEPFLIKIGDNVTVTTGVQFITHDGSGSLIKDSKGRRYYYAKIEVGNNVMIGVNSIILPGVKIHDNVIIAAGSVVSKSIPKNSIVGGVPAKIIGRMDEFSNRALKEWLTEDNMNFKLSYEERILEICDSEFKPCLK